MDMQPQRFDFRDLTGGAVVPRSYGQKAKAEVPAPPPPPPTYSEEQLKAAEREYYKKGFLDGVQDGHKQAESEQAIVDKNLSETVEKFAVAIAPLFADYQKMAQMIRGQVPDIALAVARKVAGQAIGEQAAQIVADMAARACETMINEPKLAITVHESVADTLTQKLEKMGDRLPAATQIVVLRSKDMPFADCRVEWESGSMERQTDSLWQRVEKVIADMTDTAGREAQKDMDALASSLTISEGDPLTPNLKE